MGFREDILRKIEKKQAELIELERTYERDRAAALAYIQAMQDMLKSLPRDAQDVTPDKIFRAGSLMARTREMILAAKRPLHISEILEGLGRANDRSARASVTGALGAYVRKGEVFVRTGPNIFGLVELSHRDGGELTINLPDDFGTLKAS